MWLRTRLAISVICGTSRYILVLSMCFKYWPLTVLEITRRVAPMLVLACFRRIAPALDNNTPKGAASSTCAFILKNIKSLATTPEWQELYSHATRSGAVAVSRQHKHRYKALVISTCKRLDVCGEFLRTAPLPSRRRINILAHSQRSNAPSQPLQCPRAQSRRRDLRTSETPALASALADARRRLSACCGKSTGLLVS